MRHTIGSKQYSSLMEDYQNLHDSGLKSITIGSGKATLDILIEDPFYWKDPDCCIQADVLFLFHFEEIKILKQFGTVENMVGEAICHFSIDDNVVNIITTTAQLLFSFKLIKSYYETLSI